MSDAFIRTTEGPEASMVVLHRNAADTHGRVIARFYGKSRRVLCDLMARLMYAKLDTGEWPRIVPTSPEGESHGDSEEAHSG